MSTGISWPMENVRIQLRQANRKAKWWRDWKLIVGCFTLASSILQSAQLQFNLTLENDVQRRRLALSDHLQLDEELIETLHSKSISERCFQRKSSFSLCLFYAIEGELVLDSPHVLFLLALSSLPSPPLSLSLLFVPHTRTFTHVTDIFAFGKFSIFICDNRALNRRGTQKGNRLCHKNFLIIDDCKEEEQKKEILFCQKKSQ